MVRTLEGGSLRKPVSEAASGRHAHLLEAPLPLFAFHADDGLFRNEPAVTLPAMPASEQVAEDYTATGLSLKGHPVAFFRARLARIGAIPACAHHVRAFPRTPASPWPAWCWRASVPAPPRAWCS